MRPPACITVTTTLLCFILLAIFSRTDADFSAILSPANSTVLSGEEVTCVCSSNFNTVFPLWEINSEAYQITNLPLGYEATGSNLTFRVYANLTVVRCSFLIIADRLAREVHSNIGRVFQQGIPDVDPLESLEKCDPTNVTFYFSDEYLIIWDIDYFTPECIFLISVSSCSLNARSCTFIANNITSPHVTVSLNICLTPDHPGGVTVNVTFNNSLCREGDSSCRSRPMYIPVVNKTKIVKVKTDGIVVRNLSNMYCNVNKSLTNIQLCIDSEEIYGCFGAFESPYFEFSDDGNAIGIEVRNLTESLNRTVISVFCPFRPCTSNPLLHTQILNIELLYTNESCENCSIKATCECGICVCKNGYWGDGVMCEGYCYIQHLAVQFRNYIMYLLVSRVRTAATLPTVCRKPSKCRDGYSGNGTSCEAKCENCSQYATCKNGKCMCMEDYVGDGITCDEDVDCNNCTKQTCKTQKCSTCDEVIVVCKMCVSAESNSKDLRWLAS
ncbi:hypothetical protein GBAR_LOCUS17864 [Geodia barretti]|uniref:Uncharacterized protein n=1 Tax=Geodia barretti TaxID=519541 RepID=A0AA35WSS2_GEOBA|nr:hypothetical protein GBAR_LOCUS17864 [Geodia barretti]